MNLLFISSGKTTLSDLTPSIVTAFKLLESKKQNFHIETFYTDKNTPKKLLRKVEKVKPDIILVFGHDQHPHTVALKKFQIPRGLWVVNDPYSIGKYEKIVKEYDFVITEEASCVPFYKEKKEIHSIHFPLGVNPNNYYPMDVEKKYDICFVGLPWPTRVQFFNQLIPSLSGKRFLLVGKGWERLAVFGEIKENIYPDIVSPIEASKYYNETKIVLNIHREPNDVNKNPYNLAAYTPNNRTFDIAASKAFQLITHREDLEHYFQINKEIVSYQDIEELVNKIEYFLNNDTLREEIAENAYKRVMNEHTYYHRVEKLISDLQKFMPKT